MSDQPATDQQPVYDERDRLVILTPCFAFQVTTLFRNSLNAVLGGAPTARFRCADGTVRTLPIVAMAIDQPNDSHIDRARNTILWQFEQTHYRHALFCDADQPFEPGDIARTWSRLMTGIRVLGGCVALKTIVTTFALNLKPGAPRTPDAAGLFDGQDTGTGWLAFKRDVLDDIREQWPKHVRAQLAASICDAEDVLFESLSTDGPTVNAIIETMARLGYSADLAYTSNGNTATAGQTLHAYFASGVTLRDGKGDWLSEDWMFCHRCLQLGIPIKIDPQIRIKHLGPMLYPADPCELIEAALQVTSGKNPPFDRNLAARAAETLKAIHDDLRDDTITILHATRRPEQALAIRSEFLAKALNPDKVEYLLACDQGDVPTITALNQAGHLPLTAFNEQGGIVAPINAAADKATGRILVMAADDCHPPLHWDREIREALKGQLHLPRLLWVSDGYSDQPVATHPIMTRALYETHGWFFHPDYAHLFCDTDLTVRAQAAGVIIDGRHIEFRHAHPMFTGQEPDALHRERNTKEAWEKGRATFRRLHPKSQHPHAADKPQS